MWNRWANRIAVCGGGLICLAVRLFFSVFLALFSRFPYSHCFSCFFSQLSFLSFPSSVSLYSAPDFLFLALLLRFCFDFRFSCSALPHCLAWARDRALMARLAGAKQPWPAVRLCRCAPRLASGLAPRCADCSSLPLCALGRRLGARRARIQFPDAPPGSSEPGGREKRCGWSPHAWESEARVCSTKRRACRRVAGRDESRPKQTGTRLGAGKRAAPSGRAGERNKGKGKRKGRERKREEKRKYARRVDVKKKPSEIVAPLSLRLSRCAGSKKSNPDFQRPIERLSFDFSAPPRSASTGESVNAFFRLSQGNKREGKSRAGKNPAERRQEQRG